VPRDLRIELRTENGTTWSFHVDGEFRALTPLREFKEAADPPELIRLTETWEITGARILAPTQEQLFDHYNSFRGLLDDRDSNPITHVRLIRDPDNSAVVERVLGSTGFQEFTVEEFETARDDVAPGAEWRATLPVNVRFSAVKVFPDDNGIIDWQQTIRYEADATGLQRITYETFLSVAEDGVDSALTVARSYAKIDASTFGTTYTYATNSDEGFDYELLDADVPGGRTARRIRCTSSIQQHGATLGGTTAGATVGDAEWSVECTSEGRTQTEITRASAIGPGALAWCKTKKPAGAIARTVEFHEKMKREARCEWTKVSTVAGTGEESSEGLQTRLEVSMVLRGGGRDVAFLPTSGGFAPIKVVGPFQPARLEVSVRAEAIGDRPTNADIRFPAKLTSPWVFVDNESREDPAPKLKELNQDPGASVWERLAEIVYIADRVPSSSSLSPLTSPSASLESYKL